VSLRKFFRSIIRSSAFFSKEMAEVLRQPRLILTLILGPFLILLLFGAGFRNEARPLRTIFVADPQSPLASQIEEFSKNSDSLLVYGGITPDENQARQELANGTAGLVIVAPKDPQGSFLKNEQAEFTLYHNEIDPAQIGYINTVAQDFVDEVNRRILASMAAGGQQQASDVHERVKSARQNAAAMRQALESGDAALARQRQLGLREDLASVALAAGASAGLLTSVDSSASPDQQSQSADILTLISNLQKGSSQADIPDSQTGYSSQISELQKTEADLADLDQKLAEFQSISPNVLIQPFKITSLAVNNQTFTQVNFLTPGVIAILLQHIAITIAALSIVRERRSGTMDLFRVSPISAVETLAGKYISYLVFGAFISAVLTALLYFGLKVPMNGNWTAYGIILFLVLFASLGVGFVISLLAETESQAVQFSMIFLLLSVFFSGFMLDLRYLWGPVRAVSWLLPATYGTILLQQTMLRGIGLILLYSGALLGLGLVLLLFAWLLMRRSMAHE
jgi:ABC-2 type transport system permease protein